MTAATTPQPNRALGVIAALLLMLAAVGAIALDSTPAVAGPRHQCGGYLTTPQQQLVKCRLK